MMHKVIAYFVDLQDNNRPYDVGEQFPHINCGYPVSEKRLAELAGSDNKRGIPLIVPVEEPEATEATPKKATTKRAKKTAEK